MNTFENVLCPFKIFNVDPKYREGVLVRMYINCVLFALTVLAFQPI